MVSRGFSLTEMLVVVAIVGLVAAAAVTSLSNSDGKKLDAAANEVVSAIRFARAEAMRTGKGHGISASTSSQRIRVYVQGFFGTPSYSVRNPVDKKLYDLRFDTDPNISDVSVTTVAIDFAGVGAQNLMGFSADGVPKYETMGNVNLLNSAEIRLGLGNDERVISVAPMTGRVTVQ